MTDADLALLALSPPGVQRVMAMWWDKLLDRATALRLIDVLTTRRPRDDTSFFHPLVIHQLRTGRSAIHRRVARGPVTLYTPKGETWFETADIPAVVAHLTRAVAQAAASSVAKGA